MDKKKIWLYALMTTAGAVSFYLGEFILVQENLKSFSGLCIGLGAAVFCLGIGNIIGTLLIPQTMNEKLTRQKNIEVMDERNTRIREKVGAKINQIVVYALSVVVLALGFMQASIIIILMVASIFLLEFVLTIVLTNYYSKKI
jgi:uncharacterized membrane protein